MSHLDINLHIYMYMNVVHIHTGIARAEYLDSYLHICVYMNVHYIDIEESHRRNMHNYENSRICCSRYMSTHICIRMYIIYIYRNRTGGICRTRRTVAYVASRYISTYMCVYEYTSYTPTRMAQAQFVELRGRSHMSPFDIRVHSYLHIYVCICMRI